MASSIAQQVENLIGVAAGHDEKIIAECVSVCQIYNLKPEDLMYKLEAINFKPSATHSAISPITMDSVAVLKTHIQRDMAKANANRVQSKPRDTASASINRSRMPGMPGRNMNVPLAGSTPMQVKMEQMATTLPSSSSVVFKGPKMDAESKKKRAYRYMYEKISERSEALDIIIDELGELIRAHYVVSELGDPSKSTDDDIVVIGRITHDADSASTSKIVEGVMNLESSRMLSSGTRVPLRFAPDVKIRGNARGASNIGLFPGAIVALRGKNGGGGYFLATEILAMPPLKPSPTSQGLIVPKADPDMGNSAVSICIACGPYTPDTNLTYKPWRNLLHSLKTSKPNVVILLGPFVDTAHPKIKAGDVDSTPSQLFRAHILGPLRNFLDSSPGTIAVIVPSVRDIVSRQAVFPQAELDSSLFNSDPRIHLLPNPSRFSVNDISFAASSVDVLFHLRKEEILKRGQEIEPLADDTGSDSMANICRHLLQQRSFYPIFPAPQELSHEVNLDISHSEGLKIIDDAGDDFAPDVLILPSKLKHFAKPVGTTTTINPSFLSKGTYAAINIAGKNTTGGLNDRLKVEIMKLEE